MLKEKDLTEGAVLSIKVREDSYTLSQLKYNYTLEVYDIFRETDEWSGVDLNQEERLFCIVVATTTQLLGLFSSKLNQVVIADK